MAAGIDTELSVGRAFVKPHVRAEKSFLNAVDVLEFASKSCQPECGSTASIWTLTNQRKVCFSITVVFIDSIEREPSVNVAVFDNEAGFDWLRKLSPIVIFRGFWALLSSDCQNVEL